MKAGEKIIIGALGVLAGFLLGKMKGSARVGMVFKNFTLKLQGMRKAQDFTIYPYDGGDTVVLQSDTRIMQLNLKTGQAILSKAHSSGSYFHHLNTFAGAYLVSIPPQDLVKIQEYLWNNSGTQKDSGLMIENKELFSYDSWEDAVINEVQSILDISRGDAQGVVEAQHFYMTQAWGRALSAREAAEYILQKSRT